VNDLVGGHVAITFAGWGAVRSPVEAGLARVLAVAQSRRLTAAPQFPTAAEAGLPGYEFVTWFGIVAPKGTSAAVVATLTRHIHAMQDDAQVAHSLAESGLEVLKESPDEFALHIRRDYERLGPIVKAAKLKPE
jgi:tripartite-type tricarboxylate transporter receptor subunit TctC